ncbi:unnamed protein product [Allacma fusca]|uniref:Uncharacterized protein n=1 Tax=Allacma fusca TaxID=39272 RepID=A0A8J2L0F2_9HEXA|nr:unnamed protein product [Allacma fusca]
MPEFTTAYWDISWRDDETVVGILKDVSLRVFGYQIDVSDRDQVTKCALQDILLDVPLNVCPYWKQLKNNKCSIINNQDVVIETLIFQKAFHLSSTLGLFTYNTRIQVVLLYMNAVCIYSC